MDARELAEYLKDTTLGHVDPFPNGAETSWGYGDADFFVDVEDEGRFLVSVVKVSE